MRIIKSLWIGRSERTIEAYGVNVVYDEETKTWTIDFGLTVTDIFLEAETVKFYFVIHDWVEMRGEPCMERLQKTPLLTRSWRKKDSSLKRSFASNDY